MGFIFGGNTGDTYEGVQRKRKIAEQLYGKWSGTPRNVGEGLTAIGDALAARAIERRADKREKELRDEWNSEWASIFGGGYGGSIGGDYGYSPQGGSTETFEPRTDAEKVGDDTMAALGKLPTNDAVASYIAEAATARGIDPQVAIAVAKSEGLGANPADGWQSNVMRNGVREPSYGPFQLFTGGGLGNEFIKQTGLDPRDPMTWKSQVDFALDQAAKGGWGPWYGAARVGIGNMQGIPGGTGGQPPSAPSGAAPRGTAPTGGVNPMQIAAMLSNPMATPGQKAVMQMLLSQQMQAQDPLRQIQLEKARLDLERARNPETKTDYVYVDDYGGFVDKNNPQAGVVQLGEVGPKVDPEGEGKVRKEFSGLQPVKEFQAQSQAYGRIAASAKDPSPAGDLAMIFNYMKLLDPGSVVRESEFATAQGAAAWLQRSEEMGIDVPAPVAQAIRKAATGQMLSGEQRQDFLSRAGKLYIQAEQQHEGLAQQYSVTAEDYGYNPDRTIPDFRYKQTGAPTLSQRPNVRPGSESVQADEGAESNWRGPSAAEVLQMHPSQVEAMMSAYDIQEIPDDVLDAIEQRVGQ